MRRKKPGSGLGGIIILFIIIILAAAVPVILLLGPQLDLSILVQEKPEVPEEPAKPALDPDTQRYFDLKAAACNTTSKDFLIVTRDTAWAEMQGLIPSSQDESIIVASILQGYSFNQTTKTYLRGDQMKRSVLENGSESITIWKSGRIYECRENCTMRIMDENESEEYYEELYRIRNDCAYFGKTELPENINTSLLLDIEKTGVKGISGYRCDNFLISGNASYIQSLNATLEEDQRALLWALSHLDSPLQECLDESSGIVVLRNMTMDLTDSYNLEFNETGYMKLNQITELTYFTDSVPEEFLALPS